MLKALIGPAPIEVFISFAQADAKLLKRLTTYLESLKQEKSINDWHGRMIPPGAVWEEEIDKHIKKAKVILLLVSPAFIASDYCRWIEVRRALKRVKTGKAIVIPIILRATPNWNVLPFGQFQALPSNAKPVTDWPKRDEAFLNIVEGIRNEVKKFRARQVRLRALIAAVLLVSGTAFYLLDARFVSWPRSSEASAGSSPSAQPNLMPAPVASPPPAPAVVAQASPTATPTPTTARATVSITVVPPYDPIGGPNSEARIAGKVSGVAPENYRIVIYALTSTWWVQPTTAEPLTEIKPDGEWEATIRKGVKYVALLVRPDFVPPPKPDTPPTHLKDVVAWVEVDGKK